MLTLFAIRNAKAKDKPYKLFDGSGLHLLITPGGTKLWRFRYRSGGKQLMIGFGPFPEITISEAREKREEARKLVAKGVDPSKQRKEERRAAAFAARNTFRPVAKDYLVVKVPMPLASISALIGTPLRNMRSLLSSQLLARLVPPRPPTSS